MANCLHPQLAWQIGYTVCKADGHISPRLEFSEAKAYRYFCEHYPSLTIVSWMMDHKQVSIPCGKCFACQMRKRKDMTVRLANEISMHDECCFITLTYNDENLPYTNRVGLDSCEKELFRGFVDGALPTLLPKDVQDFLKRLRRHLTYRKKKDDGRDYCEKIRYFAVGEYGTKTRRPHYHLLIFGWSPKDKIKHEWKNGYWLYRSAQVEKLWRFGFSTVGDVNAGVAKYCAKYVTKKYVSKPVSKYQFGEFTLQSKRDGGIGSLYVKRYWKSILDRHLVTVRNGDRFTHYAIPKYYDRLIRKLHYVDWCDFYEDKIAFIKRGIKVDYDAILRRCAVDKLAITREIERDLF